MQERILRSRLPLTQIAPRWQIRCLRASCSCFRTPRNRLPLKTFDPNFRCGTSAWLKLFVNSLLKVKSNDCRRAIPSKGHHPFRRTLPFPPYRQERERNGRRAELHPIKSKLKGKRGGFGGCGWQQIGHPNLRELAAAKAKTLD